jgi:pyridoxal phosphate enzyme (YggS family)
MSALTDQIAAHTAAARDRIVRAGGDLKTVKIVAVTKGFGPEHLAAAYAAGLRDFGENYADELLSKWGTVGRSATWHFLGAVQRNKVGRLAPYVDCWQAVSRPVEGAAILRRRAEVLDEATGEALEPARLFVEVETTGLHGRGGCPPDHVPGVVSALRDLGCRVEGLMTVAPAGDPGLARSAFDTVARLRDDLGLKELSMGMSEDLEQAVAAGATMVRLGTALFGPRPQRRRL